jgi:hypothetical protein
MFSNKTKIFTSIFIFLEFHQNDFPKYLKIYHQYQGKVSTSISPKLINNNINRQKILYTLLKVRASKLLVLLKKIRNEYIDKE